MSGQPRFANHDPKVISIFEVIASYYVDSIYNHVYASARTNVGGGSSLTDEYQRRIHAYILGHKTDERCYGDVVQGLHRFFTAMTRYQALSFGDFVDRIVGVCVPEDYYRQFSAQDKDEILSSVLCDLVSNLAAFATRPDMLRRIIDEHDRGPEVTIRMLQDAAVNALIAKRAALHNKFLRKMGQARDTVTMDVVDDMKRALRRLVKEKREVQARAEDAEEAIHGLKRELREARAREAKLRKLVELLRAGKEGRAAAAGAALRLPTANTVGEDPLDVSLGRPRVPRRERIAERRRAEDDDDEDDESDEDDEGSEGDESDESEEDERASRSARGRARAPVRAPPRAPQQPKGGPPAVTASFFKTGPPLPSAAAPARAGTVTAAQLGQRPPSTPAGRGGPKAPGRPQPAMLTNLLENVVDTGSPDADLDEILYGGGP